MNLIELQNKIKKYDINNFKIISISVDPNHDTPERMKDYAQSMNIDLSNWEFLTGEEEYIYDIVQSGFSLAVGQDSLAPVSHTMGMIYDKHRDEDKFLYIRYSGEATFG